MKRCGKTFPCIAHGNFTILRPNFYDYSFCRSEIIGVTTDFSGHTVYSSRTASVSKTVIWSIYVKQAVQLYDGLGVHRRFHDTGDMKSIFLYRSQETALFR